MKTNLLPPFARALALVLACWASATASAEILVRPGLLYAAYANSELSAEIGGSVAIGKALGPTRQHELSFEVGQVGWELERPTTIPGIGTSGSGHFTPLLANYRYYFTAADPAVGFRAYAGVSAGTLLASGDVTFSGSGARYGGSPDSAFLVGGTLGAVARLGDTLSADLSYRYWAADGANISGGGPAIAFPDPSAHVITLALQFSF